MKQHDNEFPVKKMAQVLNVSRAGYYRYIKSNVATKRTIENKNIIEKIKKIYEQNRGVYGSPRIHKALQKNGELYSRKRIAKLMKENNIQAKTVKKYRKSSVEVAAKNVAANILQQEFTVQQPNKVWCADITSVDTKQGLFHVAVVLDLFSRRIVGLSMSNNPNANLVSKAFEQAIYHRKPKIGLVAHSDRGVQYTSHFYKEITKKHGATLSMSAKGNCYDNAAVESFFHTLKSEHISFFKYQTHEEARLSIFEYIELFYNRIRIHSTLGYLSPTDFEKQNRMSRVKPALPAAEALLI